MASAMSPAKAALIWLHKWLGVALVLLFLMWFVSGIVLYFVPFPSLGQAERLAALPHLPISDRELLTSDEAGRRAGVGFVQARLGVHDGRPVWRLLGGKPAAWVAVDAYDGTTLPRLDAAAAARVAESFSGRRAISTEFLEQDQWTVPQGLNPHRPLFKVGLDGGDGLELYVSATSGEVVRDTRRAERFWNWVGAVPHWIYPTVLRQFPQAWNQTVVWLSIPGVVLALSGLVLGVWQLFLNRSRWIPYRKFWMRWHHIVGLMAGVVTLTWIFSGLMSMNPYGVFSARGEPQVEREAWTGAKSSALLDPGEALRMASRSGFAPRELEVIRFDGRPWYRMRDADMQRLMAAGTNAAGTVLEALPETFVRRVLATMRPGAGEPTISMLTSYDAQYYSRNPERPETRFNRPLPVWKVSWRDGVDVYADPVSGRLLLRADTSQRWQRVLYHGLHSLDFAPLLARPVLRDFLVVSLSILGIALCLTSLVIAWRVLAPKQRPARSV